MILVRSRSVIEINHCNYAGILCFLIVILGSVSLGSCGGNNNVANILPPDIQYSADTMFARKRRTLKKELDSICMQERDVLVKMKVDSLIILERKSIKNITDGK